MKVSKATTKQISQYIAAKNYDELWPLILELKRSGYDISSLKARDKDGNSLFLLASLNNCSDVVEAFLEDRSVKPNAPNSPYATNNKGENAAHLACSAGCSKVVRQLLTDGQCQFNIRDKAGSYPIHNAVRNNFLLIVVELLADSRIEKCPLDARKQMPLHLAAMQGNGVIGKLLVDAGAPLDPVDDKKRSPLHYAAMGGHGGFVALLVRGGANTELLDKAGYGALHHSIHQNHLRLTYRLITEFGCDREARTAMRGTPYHVAAWLVQYRMVKLLRALGCKPYARNDDGGDTVTLVNVRKMYDADKALYLLGKVRILVKFGKEYRKIVHAGGREEKPYEPTARELLENMEDEFRCAITEDDCEALVLIVARPDANKILSAMIDKIASSSTKEVLKLGSKDSHEKTAMHKCAGLGKLDLVQALHEGQAVGVDEKDVNEDTAFHDAAANGQRHVVEFLAEKALYTPNKLGRTPCHKAASAGHTGVVDFFLKHEVTKVALQVRGKVIKTERVAFKETIDSKGISEFHAAVIGGHYKTVMAMMPYCEINAKILQSALSKGHIAISIALIEYGVVFDKKSLSEVECFKGAQRKWPQKIKQFYRVLNAKLEGKLKSESILHYCARNGLDLVLGEALEAGCETESRASTGHTYLQSAELSLQVGSIALYQEH